MGENIEIKDWLDSIQLDDDMESIWVVTVSSKDKDGSRNITMRHTHVEDISDRGPYEDIIPLLFTCQHRLEEYKRKGCTVVGLDKSISNLDKITARICNYNKSVDSEEIQKQIDQLCSDNNPLNLLRW